MAMARPIPEYDVHKAKATRKEMAKVFAVTQREMSEVVDDLALKRRSAVPYHSSEIVHDVRNPIPEDAHLIPSKDLMKKPTYPNFEMDRSGATVRATGKPWATYERPTPEVYAHMPTFSSDEAGPPPPPFAPAAVDEEMWRTQYLEWTLQKNAYNPDIAAQLRTNVRKQSSLSMVDPATSQDPARTSENVQAALLDSEVTGPMPKVLKEKLTLANVFPR